MSADDVSLCKKGVIERLIVFYAKSSNSLFTFIAYGIKMRRIKVLK
jgi:hypothetical protein